MATAMTVLKPVNGTDLEQCDEAIAETRDEAVVAALVAGKTTRAVQREFKLSTAELDQALERVFPLDVAARLRTVRGDLALLDGIIRRFYLRAVADDGTPDDALIAIKAQERKSQLLGLDCAQKVDLQIVRVPQVQEQHDRMRKVIQDFLDRQPKDEREAHNLVGKLGAQRALQLLKSGGDVLPDPEPDPRKGG